MAEKLNTDSERRLMTPEEIEAEFGHEGGTPLILMRHPEIDIVLPPETIEKIQRLESGLA